MAVDLTLSRWRTHGRQSSPGRKGRPAFGAALRTTLPCLLLPPILWGSNFVVGRAIHDAIDPISLNFYRWLIALIFLAPICWLPLRRCWRLIAARWLWVLALSLLSVVSFNSLVYLALSMTTSAQGALIHAATPFVTMALTMIIIGEQFCGRLLAGSLLSFGGAVLVITDGVVSLSFNRGDGLMLATVFIWALFSVLLKKRPREIPALALLSVVIAVGVILQTPLYLMLGGSLLDFIDQAPEAIAASLYLGIVASALAYWLWDKGIEAVGPAAASQYFHLMPLSAAVMAWCLLDETLSKFQWVGAGLVLAGLIAAQSPWINKRSLELPRDEDADVEAEASGPRSSSSRMGIHERKVQASFSPRRPEL